MSLWWFAFGLLVGAGVATVAFLVYLIRKFRDVYR